MSRQVCACGSAHAGIAFATVDVCAIIERARVVGVLDTWQGGVSKRYYRIAATHDGSAFECVIGRADVSQKRFEAPTRDAARAAAAKAIEAGEV